MQILVTGHAGYIGAVMVPMLLGAGHRVVGLDSGLFARCAFTDGTVAVPEIAVDVREVTVADLEGFDAVIHLAGLSNDPLGNLNPALTDEINHLASVRLARLAKEVGVSRFLFSSSCSNYGAAGDALVTEETQLRPRTPYAQSKVNVEHDVARLGGDGFSPVFLRNATAYGVSPRLRFDLVLNNLVAWAFTTGRILIKSDGTPWPPIVHIEDISRAFLAVLEAPGADAQRDLQIGVTEENYRIRDLAEIVRDVVPGWSSTTVTAGPIPAATGWTLVASPAPCRSSGPDGQPPREPESRTPPAARSVWPQATSKGRATDASITSSSCWRKGASISACAGRLRRPREGSGARPGAAPARGGEGRC
jgi:nucleoside-diphosphate-sugar epimerase